MSRSASKSPTEDLSEEDIHDVLRNRRRRLVIDILRDAETPVRVSELSKEIGSIESGRDPPPSNVRQSVYVSLLQTHLPKLDELGIIEYESEGKTVSVEGGLKQVSVFMETVPKYGISRSEYYAALGLLGLLITIGSEVGVPALSTVTGTNWAYMLFAFVFASATYHSISQGNTIIHRLFRD